MIGTSSCASAEVKKHQHPTTTELVLPHPKALTSVSCHMGLRPPDGTSPGDSQSASTKGEGPWARRKSSPDWRRPGPRSPDAAGCRLGKAERERTIPRADPEIPQFPRRPRPRPFPRRRRGCRQRRATRRSHRGGTNRPAASPAPSRADQVPSRSAPSGSESRIDPRMTLGKQPPRVRKHRGFRNIPGS